MSRDLLNGLTIEGGQKEVNKMNEHRYGDCSFCKGEVKLKNVEIDYRWRGKLYVFRNVPAGVCRQCGEKYFTAKVAKEMEKIVQTKQRWTKTMEVPVESFIETVAT